MNSLVILVVFMLNNAPNKALLPMATATMQINRAETSKWDLPACKPVRFEFINEADRSA